MADQKIIGKALRLKRLADQGVGGERDAARKALEKLIASGSVTLEDLVDKDEDPQLFEFTIKGVYERKLFIQTACMVLKNDSVPCFKYRNKVHALLTPKQAAEVDATFDHYKREWAVLQEKAFKAMIVRHNIFSGIKNESPKPSLKQMIDQLETERLASQLGTKQFSGKLQLT